MLCLALLNCQSFQRQIVVTNDSREIADHIFIDEDTLQLSVAVVADELKEPIALKRQRLCQVSELATDERLFKLYPQTKNIAPKKKIHTTLYLDGGGCQKVIRYSAPNLKKQLQKS